MNIGNDQIRKFNRSILLNVGGVILLIITLDL